MGSATASQGLRAPHLISRGHIFHLCQWGSKWNLFYQDKGFLWDTSDLWLSKVLCKLYRKTNVKVVVGIKQTNGTFASTLLKVNRQKIYYLHGKRSFLLFADLPCKWLQPPAYVHMAECAGDNSHLTVTWEKLGPSFSLVCLGRRKDHHHHQPWWLANVF